MLPIYSSRRWIHAERRAAHDARTVSSSLARTSHMEKLHCQTMARWSIARATELLAGPVEIIAPSTPAITIGNLEIRPWSPASRATLLGQRQQSRHAAGLQRRTSRLGEPVRALKVINQLART
jgi:hypothetical protein